MKEIRAQIPSSPPIETLVAFLEKSERGICG